MDGGSLEIEASGFSRKRRNVKPVPEMNIYALVACFNQSYDTGDLMMDMHVISARTACTSTDLLAI